MSALHARGIDFVIGFDNRQMALRELTDRLTASLSARSLPQPRESCACSLGRRAGQPAVCGGRAGVSLRAQ
jgi:hypothetical protein